MVPLLLAGGGILTGAFVIYMVYSAGERSEKGREAVEIEKEVSRDNKINDNVADKVRRDNRGKPVSDGLRPYYRD